MLTESFPPERHLSLRSQRLAAVYSALRGSGALTVLDIGCGEGRLLKLLQGDKTFTRIVGFDSSTDALVAAARRVRMSSFGKLEQERLTLIRGSILDRDWRIQGFDAAVPVEVIEHLDLSLLPLVERQIFEFAKPKT